MRAMRGSFGLVAALSLAACAAGPAPAAPVSATPAVSATPPGAARGTVTGTLRLEGGPIRPGGGQPGKRPIPGTVQFDARHQRPVTIRAGGSGTFSVSLRPGTYHVSARSPRVIEVSDGASRETSCTQPVTVRVVSRRTTKIALVCIVP